MGGGRGMLVMTRCGGKRGLNLALQRALTATLSIGYARGFLARGIGCNSVN